VIVVGRFALFCALVFALGAVAFTAIGLRARSRSLLRSGYLAVYGLFFAVVVASSVLLSAFISRDFSFAYVAANSDNTLSSFYRLAGFWAGQQGSLLLWLLMLSVATVVIALRNVERLDRLTAGAVGVLAAVAAFLAVLMVADQGSNPFVAAGAGAAGQGLNPLLLHPAMVFHPPALFAAYAALTVPFAFATAALLLGDTGREWVLGSQRWTVAGWALLTLGIGLGAWWAYVVLSWGGYWGWDPVENTSLIPWLTATALLHSMNLYRRRGLFKRWTLALACATFWLALLATWTTRTGLIASVHAFERNDTLIAILTALLVVVAVSSASLLAWRWRSLGAAPQDASKGVRPGVRQSAPLGSRDILHSLTNVGLCACAAALLLATVAVPLLFDRTVTPATYRMFAQPLGVVVVAALALCPLLGGARASGSTMWRALLVPLLVAVLVLPLLLATGDWRSNLFGLSALEVCVLAAAALVWSVVVGARQAAGEQGLLTGLRRTLIGSRTRSAAYVAHCGVILVLVGLLGSNVYKIERGAYVAARPGATAQVAGYTLRFTGYTQDRGPQRSQRIFAHFVVTRGGRRVGLIAPHTDIYPQAGAALRAVILGSLGRDLFVVAQDPFDAASTHLRLQLDVFPLVDLVWVGTLLMVAGGAVSLWPRRAPSTVSEKVAQTVAAPARESTDEAPARRGKTRATPDDALGDEV
jgi:cytochrome c-type biogenesis protein CcmF